jgi:hypothetical protein
MRAHNEGKNEIGKAERKSTFRIFTGANRGNGGGTGVPPVFLKFRVQDSLFPLSVPSAISC